MDQQIIDYWFAVLNKALADRPLKSDPFLRGNNALRFATCDEFMLMSQTAERVAFKHCDTRNYVFLRKDNHKLEVPETSDPFMLGKF